MRKLGAAIAMAAILLAGAQAQAANKKVTIGDVGSGSSLHWPAYIAMSKGLFEKSGLEIEFIPVQTSAGVFQHLSAGSLDMGTGGFPDPLRAIDKGGAIRIFRTEGVVAPYELMVKPSIKSYADLKGKTVMIDTPKGNTRLYLDRMITPNGLKFGDFDLVYAGATAARFQALASGAVDATLINPPYNFKARALGFGSLGDSGPSSRDVPSISRTVRFICSAAMSATRSASPGRRKTGRRSTLFSPPTRRASTGSTNRRTGARRSTFSSNTPVSIASIASRPTIFINGCASMTALAPSRAAASTILFAS